jgi:hypothetical protein
MTKIIPLPASRRDCGPAVTPITVQNVVAIGTPSDVPITRVRNVELELLDRIRIWINEGGGGGDVQ